MEQFLDKIMNNILGCRYVVAMNRPGLSCIFQKAKFIEKRHNFLHGCNRSLVKVPVIKIRKTNGSELGMDFFLCDVIDTQSIFDLWRSQKLLDCEMSQ